MSPALVLDDLTIAYGERAPVVRGLSLEIAPGEAYGLVGESGSGKSTVALAVARYLPRVARIVSGSLRVAGSDPYALDDRALRELRTSAIAMVYQEPGRALNPTMRVGRQLGEVFELKGIDGEQRRAQVLQTLARVGFDAPETVAARYPHELSGGQQQRVVIAMALAVRPALLVLDEPTTGLDAQVQAGVLELIERLRDELGAGVLLISHNLPLIAAHCDRVGILAAGELVEEGDARTVVERPSHPYTRALVAAVPRIDAPPPARDAPPVEGAPVVHVRGLTKRYGAHAAVRDVDLEIGRGEVFGLVGESGSGKTTLGRAIAGLTAHDGDVRLIGRPQMVFQSPDASLNPRRTVRKTLARAIRKLGGDQTPAQLAEQVGLGPELLDRLPGELSGGQKQRVAIARAFAGPIGLVVCDEATSALDVSVQAKILDLLRELQSSRGVSYLFVSHDLAVVRRLADRVGVMYRGELVEVGDAEQIFTAPQHPYTQAILAAAITPEPSSHEALT
ncbi:ABC transporter ATP-binding protein [Conexibacter stalactiti]|uniref:ABC transporter ATP-binding protein n=1 Tax=Conexibacter stalactiti TaxID=1940611 RepID=A0ABU4HLU9_9ACTN|nr:ABC transporter ATP-binding protein [Conexibacter stalactiti]MDW5594276.1 ABC transporter ATP-binding protein [Conexibacter stalactiti]MEC5034918.1 ABC transporter ATP-binding protein [Conexibacter stalactiti]